MQKESSTSFYEDLARTTSENEKIYQNELKWLKKNGNIVGAGIHRIGHDIHNQNSINFDQPHGLLRDWIREVIRGRAGF